MILPIKKEEIRKEFFKLKIKGHSYFQCRRLPKSLFNYDVTTRTLQRSSRKIESEELDLSNNLRRPKTIYYKITEKDEKKIVAIKKKTGWGERKCKFC